MQYRVDIGIFHRRGATLMAGKNLRAFPHGIELIFNQGSLIGMDEGQLLRQHAARGP